MTVLHDISFRAKHGVVDRFSVGFTSPAWYEAPCLAL